jgi:hypothetical protein
MRVHRIRRQERRQIRSGAFLRDARTCRHAECDRGVFHIWRQGDTPTEEAEATVKAYLSHLRSRWLFRLDGPLLRWGLVFVSVFLIRQLYYVMTGVSGP